VGCRPAAPALGPRGRTGLLEASEAREAAARRGGAGRCSARRRRRLCRVPGERVRGLARRRADWPWASRRADRTTALLLLPVLLLVLLLLPLLLLLRLLLLLLRWRRGAAPLTSLQQPRH
jgi:hypothetical protein